MIFKFEQDFADSLRCIPMIVRLKLDQCGIKLKLHQWLRFSYQQRQSLVDLPTDTADNRAAYRAYLIHLIESVCQEQAAEVIVDPNPAWEDATTIPDCVLEQAAAKGVVLTLELWQKLTPLQRFALIKLSRPGHENRNFLPAFQEFSAPHTYGHCPGS
ncbi:nitrate reductase associated protein [Synechococcus sp. W65.1]|uniref:nitrate reductase associated protein n=1 Tax=unclassified Synechococcus TaxID=2626047 RepID=UPI0039C37153